MADAKDVATAVQAALDEIGVTGTLDVAKDGAEATKTIGTPSGDDVHVNVDVENAAKGDV
ncbi:MULTISPECIES: hypothetical protein [unclassified Sphingomonas]|uniref:hypothetical protein n=1 Tax=unclassified Sphingomonas TaxID=196159 RepID=UPI00226A69FB|nr:MULTISPECIES: hypothetical protein [unclassified Sphingomonas]